MTGGVGACDGDAVALLRVSLVSYRSPEAPLRATIASLVEAARRLAASLPCRTTLALVDNSERGDDAVRLRAVVEDACASGLPAELIVAGRNLGYGAANNLAQNAASSAAADYVLVLNPDVLIEADALNAGVGVLRSEPGVAAVLPRAVDRDGRDLHLGRRYPGLRVLLARGYLPRRLVERCPNLAAALARYALHDRPPTQPHDDTQCASGCFMLIRGSVWRAAGGFDPRFFLYFEDYDLSLRLRRHGPLRYLPQMRIRHDGGGAARKGWRHTLWFAVSAWRFFRLHGWRW